VSPSLRLTEHDVESVPLDIHLSIYWIEICELTSDLIALEDKDRFYQSTAKYD